MTVFRSIVQTVLATLFAFSVAAPAQEPFPMAKGTRWTYSARVKWDKNGSQPAGVRTLTWTSTVVDSFHGGDVSAALLHGSPWDLAFYSPGKKQGDYLVVCKEGTYYLVQSDAQLTFDEIKAGKKADPGASLADDIWFQMPMDVTDTYCAPDQEESAPFNCWSVEKITQTHSLRIPGFRAGRSATEYFLAFLTNPDTTTLTFVPGAGIVTWDYEHHGTVSEASVKLVSFHAGTATPARVSPRKPRIQTRKVK